MIPLDDMSWGSPIHRLWTMSWQASCLIVLVIVIQRCFGSRLSARWRHALWWPVLLRLALPLTPSSSWSLHRWLPSPLPLAAAGISPNASFPSPPLPSRPHTDATSSPLVLAAQVPNPAPLATTAPNISAPPAQSRSVPSAGVEAPPSPPSLGAQPAGTGVVVAGTPPPSKAKPSDASALRFLGPTVFGLWLLGFLVVLLPPWLGLIRLRARLRARPIALPQAAREAWNNAHVQFGVTHPIPGFLCSEVQAPALVGVFRPILLAPPRFCTRFSSSEWDHVFRHELAHVRRRDPAQNALLLLLQAVHWFNPLVWIAFRRLRADREEAADALALSGSNAAQASDYGLTLLKMVEELSDGTPRPRHGLVGILENADRLSTRVEAIARFHTQPRTGSAIGIACVTALAAFGLTDAPDQPTPVVAPIVAAIVEQEPEDSPPPPLLRRVPEWPQVTNGPTLRVRVIDDTNDAPIPLAEVVAPFQAAIWGLEPTSAPRWITDDSGSTVIRLGTIPEPYSARNPWFTLSVRAPGYASRGHSWSVTQGDARESVRSELEVRLRRGLRAGGVVTDARGQPLAGVRVSAIGSGYRFGPDREQDYPEFWRWEHESSALVTDTDGRWWLDHLPEDLERLTLECRRPDGMIHRFVTDYRNEPFPPPPSLDLAAVRRGAARVTLPEGHTLHGRVLDSQGKPLATARVRAGFGSLNRRLVDETRTDRDGRFAFHHRDPIEWILSVDAPRHASTSLVVRASAATPEIQVSLAPPEPLRLQVTDATGRGWPGAEITLADWLMEPQFLEVQGRTDSEGRWVWNRAPLGSLALRISPGDGQPPRIVRLGPGERSHEVRIDPRHRTQITVRARIVDRDTGQPVEVSTVAFRASSSAAFSTQDFLAATNIAPGRVELAVPADWFQPGVWRGFQLRLHAPRYGTELTDWRYFDEGDWEPTVRFRRGGAVQGRIHRPDGAPAEDAELTATDTPERSMALDHTRRFRPYRDHREPLLFTQVHTDAQGRFGANHPGSRGTYLVTHPSGFLEIPAIDLASREAATLQPWARLEGTLRAQGHAITNATVVLRRDTYGRANMRWHCFLGTTTDATGRFVFTNVPAGDYVLHRFIGAAQGPPMESHARPVRLQAGQTVSVDYGGDGVSVTGQLQRGRVRWEASGHQLVALTSNTPPSRPLPDGFATTDRWLASLDPYYDQLNHYFNARRTYVVLIDDAGFFHAEDIPPGVYEMELQLVQGSPRPAGARHPRIPYLGRAAIREDANRLSIPIIVPRPGATDPSRPVNLGLLVLDPSIPPDPVRSEP